MKAHALTELRIWKRGIKMRKRRWNTNACTLSFVYLLGYLCVNERVSGSHC